MVAEKLKTELGNTTGRMTEAQRQEALAYGGPGLNPAAPHTVLSVRVKLDDIYLMVRKVYKRVSPPSPFAFLFISVMMDSRQCVCNTIYSRAGCETQV